VRSALRRQPAISASSQTSQETREWAGSPGFSRIRFGLRTPSSPILRWKVSGLVREYSRFAETIGGDWFDHNCSPKAEPTQCTDEASKRLRVWRATDWSPAPGPNFACSGIKGRNEPWRCLDAGTGPVEKRVNRQRFNYTGEAVRIQSITISGFRSFGPDAQRIELANDLTTVVGPNASGKTALLQCLAKMFGVTRSQRTLYRSDFHLPRDVAPDDRTTRDLFIDVIISLPELKDGSAIAETVAPTFGHQQLEGPKKMPMCRMRLEGRWQDDGTAEGEGHPGIVLDRSP
jgi:AAA domain